MNFYGFKEPTTDKEENQAACGLVIVYYTVKHKSVF